MARREHRADLAGAETIGAIILFGIFVTMIALLNITAVPQAGLESEEQHALSVLDGLNALQSEAESSGIPGKVGATVGRAIALSPEQDVGQDFFSFFLARPARASGELRFERDYGDLRVHHYKGSTTPVYDIGSATGGLAFGRIAFDQHPIFRDAGTYQLENGGLILHESGAQSMRFAPPVSVGVGDDGVTLLHVKARVFNGTDVSLAGETTVRVSLVTQAATLTTAASPNANSTVLRIATAYGPAWHRYLSDASNETGLAPCAAPCAAQTGYEIAHEVVDGLDVVTWTVHGLDSDPSRKDIVLTSGIAIHGVSFS